jgi:hypothetical protein
MTLAGCGDTVKRYQHLRGIGADIDAAEVESYAEQQQRVVTHLIRMSGQDPTTTTVAWRPVVDSGIDYVDARCERYIDAIFWFNRQKTAAVNQINLIGVATTVALGVLKAAVEELTITALGFGLASQTVDNIGTGLLYEIEPSGVRSIVERTQAAYREAIEGSDYTTRPAAMRAIQGYLALCQPATIETEVNQAIGNARFEARLPDEQVLEGEEGRNAVPSVEQVAPTVRPIVYSGPLSGTGRDIQAILRRSDGRLDQARVREMKLSCWPRASVPENTLVLDFLRSAEFDQQRRTVATCMTTRP